MPHSPRSSPCLLNLRLDLTFKTGPDSRQKTFEESKLAGVAKNTSDTEFPMLKPSKGGRLRDEVDMDENFDGIEPLQAGHVGYDDSKFVSEEPEDRRSR
jgi:hypothetical protein